MYHKTTTPKQTAENRFFEEDEEAGNLPKLKEYLEAYYKSPIRNEFLDNMLKPVSANSTT